MLGCHQYTDDLQLYIACPADPREAVETLNQCLGTVLKWMMANKLKLNVNEREVVLLSGRTDQCLLDEIALPIKEQVHRLGGTAGLPIGKQVAAVAKGAFHQLWLERQLQFFLGKKDLGGVVHALVTYRFGHCNVLYVVLP